MILGCSSSGSLKEGICFSIYLNAGVSPRREMANMILLASVGYRESVLRKYNSSRDWKVFQSSLFPEKTAGDSNFGLGEVEDLAGDNSIKVFMLANMSSR